MRDIFQVSASAEDVRALVALYKATDGPAWRNSWNMRANPSTWHGVTVSTDGRVVRIELPHNNLRGESSSGAMLAQLLGT